jgi:hypothetical protein
MFELTSTLTYTVPVMLAVSIFWFLMRDIILIGRMAKDSPRKNGCRRARAQGYLRANYRVSILSVKAGKLGKAKNVSFKIVAITVPRFQTPAPLGGLATGGRCELCLKIVIFGIHKNQIDREAEVIYADRLNSVELLRDQLERAVSSGETDGGFPVVREEDGLLKLVGYIGLNELEHALSECFFD